MAITNTNELNELLTLALGSYWVERSLPVDKQQLGSVNSYLHDYAEVLIGYQEKMGALQQGLDVDPEDEKRMWGGLHRLTSELANIFLFVAESARNFSEDSGLQAKCRDSANGAIAREMP